VATANTILLARKSRRAVRRAAQGSIEEAKKDRFGVFFFRPQTGEKCRDRVIRKVIGGTESEQQNATSD
jgi:hypothetical protein